MLNRLAPDPVEAYSRKQSWYDGFASKQSFADDDAIAAVKEYNVAKFIPVFYAVIIAVVIVAFKFY